MPSAPFAVTANASPLVSIGDNADIYFNGSSSLRWDSNVFRDESDDIDDLVLTLSPGLELDVGRGASDADLTFFTRYDIVRYDDLDRLDTELFSFGGDGVYSGNRLELSASINFNESKTNSGDTGNNPLVDDLIEFDTLRASTQAEFDFSSKISAGAGVRYSEREYKNFPNFFDDRETLAFPIDVYYKTTPKLDLSAGYTYSETEVESEYDQTSHFYNVGARGEILPKLVGFLKVGYRTREFSNSAVARDDSGSVGIDADFTWTATPKTTFDIQFGRDFLASGEGDSTETNSVNLIGTYAINSNFSANSILGYVNRDYDTVNNREDDQLNAGLRVNYSPNQYWQLSTGYTYLENDSTQAGSSYESHLFDVTFSLRY